MADCLDAIAVPFLEARSGLIFSHKQACAKASSKTHRHAPSQDLGVRFQGIRFDNYQTFLKQPGWVSEQPLTSENPKPPKILTSRLN